LAAILVPRPKRLWPGRSPFELSRTAATPSTVFGLVERIIAHEAAATPQHLHRPAVAMAGHCVEVMSLFAINVGR
jgi:hypothetical protein